MKNYIAYCGHCLCVAPLSCGILTDPYGTSLLCAHRIASQGNERAELSVWEEDKKTFNPLANWSWDDVVQYVILFNVPYIKLHRRLCVADKHVYALERDNSKDLRFVELALPYFAYSPEWIRSHGGMHLWVLSAREKCRALHTCACERVCVKSISMLHCRVLILMCARAASACPAHEDGTFGLPSLRTAELVCRGVGVRACMRPPKNDRGPA